MQNIQEGVAATVDDFRKRYEEGTPVLMPSCGMVVYLRGVGLDTMLRAGKVPDPLLPKVLDALDVFADDNSGEALQTTLQERAEGFADFIDAAVQEAWVNPPVKGGPKGKTGVDLKWIDFADKMFTMRVLSQPIAELSRLSFRDHQELLESIRAESAI